MATFSSKGFIPSYTANTCNYNVSRHGVDFHAYAPAPYNIHPVKSGIKLCQLQFSSEGDWVLIALGF